MLFASLADSSPTVFVSLLELQPQHSLDAIAQSEATLAGEAARAVYLTDSPDFSAFVKGGHFYEYLPSAAEQSEHAPEREWDIYLVRRVKVLLAKWAPMRVTAYGVTLEAFIQGARARREQGETT